MRALLVILLFLFISYATAQKRSDLQPHIELFEKNCKCKVNVPIRILKIPQDTKGERTLGVCYGFKLAPPYFRVIHIDEDYWNKATYYQRESTVLHELAHCVWDLDHDDSMQGYLLLSIRPKSIMHPYSFPQYEYNRNEYLRELWSRKPKK